MEGHDILVESELQPSHALSRAGERKLMLAVLRDAIDCFRYVGSSRTKQTEQRKAQDWILSADRSYLYSFEVICEILSLDPGYLRRGLMQPRRYATLGLLYDPPG